MEPKKLRLEELEINSFVTQINKNEKNTFEGGLSPALSFASELILVRITIPITVASLTTTASPNVVTNGANCQAQGITVANCNASDGCGPITNNMNCPGSGGNTGCANPTGLATCVNGGGTC